MKIRGRNITETWQPGRQTHQAHLVAGRTAPRLRQRPRSRRSVALAHSPAFSSAFPLESSPPFPTLPCPSNILWKQENTNMDDGVMASVCLCGTTTVGSTPLRPRATASRNAEVQRHSRHALEKVTPPTRTCGSVAGHAIRDCNAAAAVATPSSSCLFSGPADIRPAAPAGRASGATLPISF